MMEIDRRDYVRDEYGTESRKNAPKYARTRRGRTKRNSFSGKRKRGGQPRAKMSKKVLRALERRKQKVSRAKKG